MASAQIVVFHRLTLTGTMKRSLFVDSVPKALRRVHTTLLAVAAVLSLTLNNSVGYIPTVDSYANVPREALG